MRNVGRGKDGGGTPGSWHLTGCQTEGDAEGGVEVALHAWMAGDGTSMKRRPGKEEPNPGPDQGTRGQHDGFRGWNHVPLWEASASQPLE